MEYRNILWQIEENLAIVTFNRPDALNALNRAMLAELSVLFGQELASRRPRAVLLTGAGKAFVAGADIKEMAVMTPQQAREFALMGQELFSKIERYPCPVIAAINGFALGGGCELALACDIRLASPKAKFGQPEVKLGVIPGFGGTQRLARVVGLGKAKELLFSGEMITAEQAHVIGLVNHVYPPDDLLAQAKELAGKIAAQAPLAVSYCKQAVNQGYDLPLERALPMEADLFALTFASADREEGITAFIEKRPPEFKGN